MEKRCAAFIVSGRVLNKPGPPVVLASGAPRKACRVTPWDRPDGCKGIDSARVSDGAIQQVWA